MLLTARAALGSETIPKVTSHWRTTSAGLEPMEQPSPTRAVHCVGGQFKSLLVINIRHYGTDTIACHTIAPKQKWSYLKHIMAGNLWLFGWRAALGELPSLQQTMQAHHRAGTIVRLVACKQQNQGEFVADIALYLLIHVKTFPTYLVLVAVPHNDLCNLLTLV